MRRATSCSSSGRAACRNFDAVNAACAAAEAEDLDWLAFAGPLAERLPELCSPELGDRFFSYYLACGRWIPLCQAVVRRTSFLEIGGFDASPLLQREFDADFWLRSVRQGQKGRVRPGSLAESRWTWEDFPLQTDFRVPRYLSHSYRVRPARAMARHVRRFRCGFAASLAADQDRLTHFERRRKILSDPSTLSAKQATAEHALS